ncbi:MAG: hypothetical protein ACYDD4_07065 [Acidimicrobiales bacterium]
MRNRYLGSFSPGFEVAERVERGYRIRRTSDATVFPDVFDDDDLIA